MNTLIQKITSLLGASIVGVLLLSTSALAITGGLGGKPANPDPAVPRSHDIFIYTLKAQQSKDDAVVVANNTDKPQTIGLYTTDAVVTNTGAFSCEQRVESRDDVGSWIKLSKNEVTLQPGTNEKVSFKITAPKRVDVGEHNGCLAFEPKDNEGEVEGNVRIRTRSAVRVAVTIPGDLKKQVDITSFNVFTKPGGEQEFNLSISNTGNVSADTTSAVSLKTLIGTEVYANKGTYPVLAGNKYDVLFNNDKNPFWGGWYIAEASIAYDRQAGSFGTENKGNLVTKYTDNKYIFVSPEPIAVAIYAGLLIVLLLVILFFIYRRHEKKDALRNWQIYTIKQGDTIQTLAETYNVSWKKLAKINDIKPPYALNEGEKLRIPRKK